MPPPQTVPVWAVLAAASIGAVATLLGNVVFWFLKRRERVDEQRAITHEKQVDMVVEIDKEIQELFKLDYLLKSAVSKESAAEEAIKEIKGGDLNEAEMEELKSDLLSDESYSPDELREEIKAKAFDVVVSLRRALFLLPEKAANRGATLQRTALDLTRAITKDYEGMEVVIGNMWQEREELLEACRDELLVEELTGETKQLAETTSWTDFKDLPSVPKPYFEFGLRKD